MRQLLLFAFIIFVSAIQAQVISTDPAFPIQNGQVIITFNATGTGLEGATGDVYAHTGVTINGERWANVIGTWGDNTLQPKLTNVSTDLYELEITPSINDFYSVSAGENVTELCFVFRSGDGGSQSADLFVEVYQSELSVSLISPYNNAIVEFNSIINIQAAANFADSLILYVDEVRIDATTESELTNTWNVNTYGKHWIKAEAKDETTSVFDSVSYYVKGEVIIENLPAGVRYGINYIDDETVTLVLHAPNKEFVYLIGDFNNWDVSLTTQIDESNPLQVLSDTWMMNKTPEGTHFWITIENLQTQVEYAYQYFIDGKIVVADPYTEKVLDPWNDKYISDETYPNLKAYPEGKTTEPTSVFQTAQEEYPWEVEAFTPPAVTDMVVYEMLIRDFVETHAYATISDTLDYLQNLGVNVLELMPINEFEGNSSWGYNPSFYFAPDKYYGPKEELKKLVDECHKRGIAVVIDMVLNHSFGQSPLVRMYFENGKPAADNPWYNVDHNFQNPDAHWGYDFNHQSIATQELVDSVNSFWMTNYKVDGFRFDFTKGFSNTIYGPTDWGSAYDPARISNLKRMTDKIRVVNPDAYVIFEHLSDNTEEKVLANYGILLWGNITHNYAEGTMGWTESGKSDLSWISYKERDWTYPHVMAYMESHDEERMMFKNLQWGKDEGAYDTKNIFTALRRAELAACFFLTIPGPKMLWQFEELGYDYSIDENGRVGEKPIRWDYFHTSARKRLYDVFGALAKIKVNEPAFETDDYNLDVRNGVKTIHLNHSDMNVAVLGNFEVTEQSVDPSFQETGWWYEYFSGDSTNITNVNAEFAFDPGEYRLYTTKRLETPIIEDSIIKKVPNTTIGVYPNPVKDMLYFANMENVVKVAVYNMFGQEIYAINDIIQSISVSALESGVYFIKINDINGVEYLSRFIKL
ncbi:MAG: T9SS type A sorting domain-containing protein [Salinivirgaceae bacterium]|nr:T9SS type A sorting domain-containing protein [Salinivirgaceae bacterium]